MYSTVDWDLKSLDGYVLEMKGEVRDCNKKVVAWIVSVIQKTAQYNTDRISLGNSEMLFWCNLVWEVM